LSEANVNPVTLREGEIDLSQFLKIGFREIREGEVIKGKVVAITQDSVLVDIGYKSEGTVPVREFFGSDGQLAAKVGDEVEVLVEKKEDEEGLILLSRDKAVRIRVWEELNKIYETGAKVEGRVISRVKGGLTVDIGIKAFLPGSQVDIKPVRNLDAFVGKTIPLQILKLTRTRGNVVVSHRAVLEKEREKLKVETLRNLEEGQEIDGVVKNILDYGAFIDLGGIDGLLHITDLSWKRVNHPSEVLNPGDRIRVKVLKFDPERERVSLGLKQTKSDPWLNVEKKYPLGARVKGKVVSLTDYGAFIELEEGVEGLIHISEMSWTKRIKHPSQLVEVGSEVETAVLDVDPASKRISLGMRQIEPNPWETLPERYPVGTRIKSRVKSVTDFGIFIEVEEGIDGLVHISDLTWNRRVSHPSELYKKGDIVEAAVLNIDKENERFSLGIKQLEADPWAGIADRYRPGQEIKGIVRGATEFGLFVELEPGVEGLIHISELSNERVRSPQDVAKPGDEVKVMILHVDPEEKRIGLSLKALE
jgi:small subunit ribosomal protein S1